jgi:hypothetical protein
LHQGRRLSTGANGAGAIALSALFVLTLTGRVSAKEGIEAQLQTPIHLDTPPRTALTVRWSVFETTSDGRVAVTGMPVFLRLVAPVGRTASEVLGEERPKASGEYVATIIVPEGGIVAVEVGIRNVICLSRGACSDTVMLFNLTDDSLVTGSPVRPASEPADAKPQLIAHDSVAVPERSTTTAANTASVAADTTRLPSWLPSAGLASAGFAALAVLAVRRRDRHSRRI